MSSPGHMIDDETLLLSPLHFPTSPEPYTPLVDCLQNSETVETENRYNESIGLIPVSISETNPIMSSQQPNLMTYQETSSLLQNPIEMQQQLGNTHETWLQDNLPKDFLSQSMVNTFQESSVFTRNQIEIGRQVEQENNGFAHPTMTNSSNHLQELLLPVAMMHEERSDQFGTLFPHTHPVRSQNCQPYQTNQPFTPFNMFGQQPAPSVFPSRQNEPHHLRMFNSSAMRYPPQEQITMTPTVNTVLQPNISFTPRPQVSSSSTRPPFYRHHGGMQASVNQSSSRFTFTKNTQTRTHPYSNAVTTVPSGVLESRLRSYQSRLEVGQSSSFAQRRRTDENVGLSAVNLAERRYPNSIYDPVYESLGLSIDPHLRKFAETMISGNSLVYPFE